MRPPRLLAAVILAAVAGTSPASGAPAPPAASSQTAVVTATVDSTAADIMPGALWRRLVAEAVAVRTIVPDEGPALADDARCRAAHAGYAVLATFARAPRLPGIAQDPGRLYAIARFTVRNCATDAVSTQRVVALETDPLPESDRGAAIANPARAWERSVRASLGRGLLGRPAVHVLSVRAGVVTLERRGDFTVSEIVRGTPPSGAVPARAVYEMVVTDVSPKRIQATVVGKGDPRTGDTVEAAIVK